MMADDDLEPGELFLQFAVGLLGQLDMPDEVTDGVTAILRHAFGAYVRHREKRSEEINKLREEEARLREEARNRESEEAAARADAEEEQRRFMHELHTQLSESRLRVLALERQRDTLENLLAAAVNKSTPTGRTRSDEFERQLQTALAADLELWEPALRRFEVAFLMRAYDDCGGRIHEVAKRLGLTQKQVKGLGQRLDLF